MPIAFVLIDVERGGEEEVLQVLKKAEGVEEAYAVHGVHDIVAKIRVEKMDELLKETTRIRRLDKVQTTQTMLVRWL